MTSNPFRQVEKEMLFYFNQADAAVGFKSSHASFVAAVYGVSSNTLNNTDPYTDGLLRQVRKIRQIRNTYYSLSNNTQRILDACYNLEVQYRYPPEVVRIYGYKAGAVLFNSHLPILRDLINLCRKKIQSKLTPDEEVLMFKIGEETRNIWNNAHQEYVNARQAYLNLKSRK